jgi:uncharacterized protein YkwD
VRNQHGDLRERILRAVTAPVHRAPTVRWSGGSLLVLALAVTAASGSAGEPARDASAFVDAHNRLREKHCAPPLRWSARIAASAQAWASSLRQRGCGLAHSGGRYGENLAAGTAGTLHPGVVVGMWYDELKRYSFRSGGFSAKTGHFTQVVWRDTREVGCGHAACNGLELWVCQYDPPGNVEGQYRENVRPTGCR